MWDLEGPSGGYYSNSTGRGEHGGQGGDEEWSDSGVFWGRPQLIF